MKWQVICPDGRVRHYPYINFDDAESDAALYGRRNCQIYPDSDELAKVTPCPGGPHRVEEVLSESGWGEA